MVVKNKFANWKQPVRMKDNLSVAHRGVLEALLNDDFYDDKLDDKSGRFLITYKTDYIFTISNYIEKQSNIHKNCDNLLKELKRFF